MRFTAVCLLVCVFLATQAHNRVVGDVNGGSNCAGCVIVVGLIEQLSELKNTTVVQTLETLCTFLPSQFQPPCDTAVEFLGPVLVELIVNGAPPDVACHALKFCTTDPGQPTCHSGVDPPGSRFKQINFDWQVYKARKTISHLLEKRPIKGGICDIPGIKEICEWIEKFADKHTPLVDEDYDGFSTFFTARGTAWRGKDCSDASSNIHPGALCVHAHHTAPLMTAVVGKMKQSCRPQDNDMHFDSNCNGIFGVDNKTNKPYEEELCGSTQPRGVAVLGDSISAHFHLPPEWLDATQISKEAFEHLVMIVENELDWPMMSSTTGFTPNNWTEAITGPVDSMYLRLREWNLCNHRDYQNIAANGERSSSATELVQTVSRQQGRDKPLVIFYALVGNDVCNGHPDTFAHMTTPAQMYNNTMQTLEYLHENLPNGSHVVLTGLADGRVLYDNMGHRVHPLGTYWGTFTYSKFYDFFNCLQVSPCTGWMNSNQTIRDLTTQRANELSDVLKTIAKNFDGRYSNFRLYYYDNPIAKVIQKWVDQGGEGWQLIEPSDGFHANQMGNYLLAGTIWDDLLKDHPQVLGPKNPNNDLIKKLFGDQGGH